MIKIAVYLHKDIYDVLTVFGDLNDVVDRILDAASHGNIDIMDKPKCPPKQGGSQYIVEIRNGEYISLYETMGRSARISLRRLLYWFVENEVFATLGWQEASSVKTVKEINTMDELNKATNMLTRLRDKVKYKNLLNDIIKQLLELQIKELK